jgi:hypothetical protein
MEAEKKLEQLKKICEFEVQKFEDYLTDENSYEYRESDEAYLDAYRYILKMINQK